MVPFDKLRTVPFDKLRMVPFGEFRTDLRCKRRRGSGGRR